MDVIGVTSRFFSSSSSSSFLLLLLLIVFFMKTSIMTVWTLEKCSWFFYSLGEERKEPFHDTYPPDDYKSSPSALGFDPPFLNLPLWYFLSKTFCIRTCEVCVVD